MNKTPSSFLITIPFILVAMILACQTGTSPEKVGQISSGGSKIVQDPESPPQQKWYQVGDMINLEDTLLIVLGWDQPSGGDFNPPEEGKKYIAVDVLLANKGVTSFSVSPMLQMTLKDGQGQKYNASGKANAATKSNPPNGELNPGERLRGTVGFHVPETANDFTFVYEAKLIGLGEVSVDLGPAPVSHEPPTDLGLNLAQDTFPLGEAVKISDLVVQVMGVSESTGGKVIKPEQGSTFIIVDVMVENPGERIREINSGLQMYLKDKSGQKYTLHLGAQNFTDAGLPDDELQPGERVRGQIGFHVPKAAAQLTFVFDAEIVGYGKVFIILP